MPLETFLLGLVGGGVGWGFSGGFFFVDMCISLFLCFSSLVVGLVPHCEYEYLLLGVDVVRQNNINTQEKCRGHGRVELYLYPPSGSHRARNGLTLPLPFITNFHSFRNATFPLIFVTFKHGINLFLAFLTSTKYLHPLWSLNQSVFFVCFSILPSIWKKSYFFKNRSLTPLSAT